jgi:hypothetical protein
VKTYWDGKEYRMAYSPEERAKIVAYYRNPEIRWIEGGTVAHNGPLPGDGYYVLAHCGRIECCRPGGPFQTVTEARVWSRKNWLPDAEQAPQTP